MVNDSERLRTAREAMTATGIPDRFWSVGTLQDDRYCLLYSDQQWIGGYFERGSFEVEFVVWDSQAAISQFVSRVEPTYRSTTARAAGSRAWLEKNRSAEPT